MGATGTILVVDDEIDILEMIEVGLAGEGYDLILANGGARALSIFDPDSVDLVICDIKMPGLDGIAMLAQLRQQDPGLPAIVLTGYLSADTIEQCSQLGGIQLIRKPFAFKELSGLVATSLQRGRRDASPR